MRMLNLNLQDENGLSNITMKRLEKIVLVAGKNGSGKSRLLDSIKRQFMNKIGKDTYLRQKKQLNDENINLENYNNHYKNLINEIERLEQNIKTDSIHPKLTTRVLSYKKTLENKKTEVSRVEQTIKHLKINVENIENSLDSVHDVIKTDDLYNQYEIIDFLPKILQLNNPESMSISQINNSSKNKTRGLGNSHTITFSVIQDITNKWFRATHQSLQTEENFNKKTILKYNKLKEYIKIFLDADLGFDQEDGIATLFGLKLGESKLSNGQKILLQLCIAIFLQENDLEKTIIFMDEPENHLHPKALLEVINKLSEVITEGQIWIATHSINLLSNFEAKNIWYMEDGHIQHAGKIPEKVLEGLLGEQEHISKLENFISLPSQMATNNFAYECLFDPLQVETGVDDPQVAQIIDAIKTKHDDSGKVKVLDFGAGKGRLLSTIDEIGQSKNIPTIDWLDYYAYDLPSDNKQKCLDILNNIYENGEERYFDEKSKFRGDIEKNTFDMIVLSNVFHEIDPKYWNEEFIERNSVINHALKDDGTLLIIEDQLIPVGEKAYQNGFLVFDKEQFKILFNIPSYTVKEEREGRLKAHYIEKKYLVNMTHDTKKEAIESLKNTAKENISKIRAEDPSYENGKLHAFWTQQLANSYLAHSEL